MYEFDLKTFLNTVKKARKRIITNCVIAAVLGAIVAFSIPKEYLASASVAPESQDDEGLSGVSSLASMAGINLNSGTDAIGPELYPTVIASNDFVVDLLYTRVQTVDGDTMDYKTYLKTQTKMPWWGYGQVWIGKLMQKIAPRQSFSASVSGDDRIDPQHMSYEDEAMVEAVKGSISCSMDEKTMVISLAVRTQDPLVSKIMVDSVMVHLQNFITLYRTNKARNDLDYYKELETEASRQYRRAETKYSEYCDTHKGTVLQSFISEQERLENELSIALSAYTQVRQQVQMAQAKVQEKTPAFTVLERASVPNIHVSPKKMLIDIAFIFLAFIGTVSWYYVALLFGKVKVDK